MHRAQDVDVDVDREEISRGLAESLEYKEIGLRLGRDPSVISREVARHGGRERYRAAAAHEAACAGWERPKLFAVERPPRLRADRVRSAIQPRRLENIT
jgi:IS30 family transposase